METLVSFLIQDIRHGLRQLIGASGFTAVAMITIALGIGATTAVFSVVNTILLQPLPLADPNNLVLLRGASLTTLAGNMRISPPDFLDYRAQQDVFSNFAAYSQFPFGLTGQGDPEQVPGAMVTSGFFETLGVQPALGRTFTSGEEHAGEEHVAIISHNLWKRRYGQNPGLIGKTILINETGYTVIGIVPEDFQYPEKAELWCPVAFGTPDASVRRFHYLLGLGRLKPGVTLQQAQAQFLSIGRALENQYPNSNTDFGARLIRLNDDIVGPIRLTLIVLLVAVGFVLLIACANVANLLLARGAARQKELAVRSALGASRGRVVRQLLTESLLLSASSGFIGVALAYSGIRVLLAMAPANIPRVKGVAIDLRVLGFAAAVSIASGIIFGLVPAIQASRTDINEALKKGGRTGGAGGGHRVRGLLVVTEIALALILLVGASLMIRSLLHLTQVDPGFRPSGVLTMQVALPEQRYLKAESRQMFFKQIVDQIKVMPGVDAAGLISELPMSGQGGDTRFNIEGRPPATPSDVTYSDFRIASPGYFRALGIPLLKGRTFSDTDSPDSPGVVVVSQSFADQYFPSEDPIGKHLEIDLGMPYRAEIIGIAGSIRHNGLASDQRTEMYLSFYQNPRFIVNMVIHSSGEPAFLSRPVRDAIAALDGNVPVFGVTTMDRLVSDSISRPRFRAILFGVFASVALALAGVGIYGVMSFYVSGRTHEIGIRMALGARASDVLGMVLGQGMVLVGIGLGIGLGGSLLLSHIVSGLLFGVGEKDPVTFVGVPLLLLAVALLACYRPGRRATRTDPMAALRHE